MEYENERVLKLIFPNGIDQNLHDNPELLEYLYKLGTYKIEQLKKEETKLTEENKSIVEHTQDLAITNYKTFIQTSECSREIFYKFKDTEKKLDCIIEKMPELTKCCESFINTSNDINIARRLNSLTLKRNAQLLEILELPQIMDTCIREGKYEEALELASYVQRMRIKHDNIPVINSIVEAIEGSWHTMLTQLLVQLKTDLQLPKCLQVVGYLRRMQAFTTPELKLKFLQARDSWLTNILANIPVDDPQLHLTKTIELTRINLFNIITQYKATFTEDEKNANANTSSSSATTTIKDYQQIENNNDFGNIFYSWLHEKIEIFLQTLEMDLIRGIPSLDTILGQCMYFGLSFSRVGADFRGLMAPIFIKVILTNFKNNIVKVTQQFQLDIENYTLINKVTTIGGINRNNKNISSQQQQQQIENNNLSPPEILLDFHPLATYCNGLLTAFNELRLCSPIAIANEVTKCIENSLVNLIKYILIFYRQEQQALVGNDRDNFVKFCSCFAYDVIPYIQRCLNAIYPQNVLTTHLGINVMSLQQENLTYLKSTEILEPIQHLLPNKVDIHIQQVSDEKFQDN